MSTHAPSVANIMRVWRATTPEDRAYGRIWYAEAHALAVELTPDNPRMGAGVIAALSPRLQWVHNVSAARRAVAQGYASGVLGQSARAADRIMAGEDPDVVLTGPKTNAFFHAILEGGGQSVTVDMHAFNIAIGKVIVDGPGFSRKQYVEIARMYSIAAQRISRELGEEWAPAVVQAATWVYWRRERHAPVLAASKSRAAKARERIAS